MQTVDTKETIGAALWRIRVERDLTLEQVGTLVGLSATAVWRIERGLVRPQDRTVHRILKAFPGICEGSEGS